jgi:purine-binding chemotaxis protein CheW
VSTSEAPAADDVIDVNKDGVQHDTAADLRRDFDSAFAAPMASRVVDVVDLLALRLGGQAVAVRLADITGVLARPRIVRLPSTTPHLLGLAGIRGRVVPVFHLAALLGHHDDSDELRWLLLCGVDEPVALAFASFEGHLRVARTELSHAPHVDVTAPDAELLVHTSSGLRTVLALRAVVHTLRPASLLSRR